MKKIFTTTAILSILMIMLLSVLLSLEIIKNDFFINCTISFIVLFILSIFIEVEINIQTNNSHEIIYEMTEEEDNTNDVSNRAYHIYKTTGNENELENWLQAEKELEQEKREWEQYQEDYE